MSRHRERQIATIEAKLDRIIQHFDVDECETHSWTSSSIGPHGVPVTEHCRACPATRKTPYHPDRGEQQNVK